jgi:hypothetical protein
MWLSARGWRLLTVVLFSSLACARPAPPPGPTPVPQPPEISDLPDRGVAIQGHGTATTDDVTPQYTGGLAIGIDVVTLTHDGQSTFIVNSVQNDQSEQLTSAIGAYKGQRPLVVEGPVSFQVTADGAWTIRITQMSSGGKPPFSGSGDAVSPYFSPPDAGTWNISHDGQSSFFVYTHCLSGSFVVEDRTGPFQDSPRVEFGRGPCFWEVRADGAWSMAPAP